METKRARYQEMAAEAPITSDELRVRLVELDETRKIAGRELAALRARNVSRGGHGELGGTFTAPKRRAVQVAPRERLGRGGDPRR